jgi:hypothetical protein
VAASPDATAAEELDAASGEVPSEVTVEEAAQGMEAALVAALLDEPE